MTELASEKSHWYRKDGTTAYEVQCTSKEGMRPTTVADARKLDLLPSVTLILNQIAKPGLEAWKAQQLLQAALTLPKLPDESIDDYAKRVIEDSKAQGQKARDRGTELHAAIEDYIRETAGITGFDEHILKVASALISHGIDITEGKPERSFASELGYGGKIDYSHDAGIIIDFKTKATLDKKTKPYDEHLMQLAAYGFGLFGQNWITRVTGFPPSPEYDTPIFRALNVFVGIDDCEVRVFEHDWRDLSEAFDQFKLLLTFYQRKNRLGPFKQ